MCPNCRGLIHAAELRELATKAETETSAGRFSEALVHCATCASLPGPPRAIPTPVTRVQPLSFRAALVQYEQQASEVFDALKAGDEATRWRFKWEHPRFRGKTVTDVQAATLDVSDAQLVVAREYGLEDWADLRRFANAVETDDAVIRFETAVDAVISGDVRALRSMLRADVLDTTVRLEPE